MPTDSLEQDSNPFGNLIKTAVGLSPIAGAVYLGFNKIRGNTAMNPGIPFGVGTGNLTGVSQELGRNLKVSTARGREADLTRVKKVTEELMKADTIQKMFQNAEEQNVVVQSLLNTMNDPTSGLSQDVLLSYREKLMSLATNSPNTDELRQAVQAVIKSIDTQGTENSKVRLAKNLREYKKLGPSLVPPSNTLTASKTYVDLDFAGMKGKLSQSEMSNVQHRYKSLTNALGKGGTQRVQLVGKEIDGAFQVYAKVFNGSHFAAIQPLHLGKTRSGLSPVFLNEGLTTGYAAPRQILNASKLDSILHERHDLASVTKKAGMSIEDFFLNKLISGIHERGGQGFIGDTKELGAWQRQFLTVMPRESYAFPDGSHSKHLNKVMGLSQNYSAIVDWGKIGPKRREEIMTTLGTMPGFDANAPGYQMLTRGLDDETIGRMGIAEGSSLRSIKTIGKSDRGYFPVESRIEQVTGRESQFVASNHQRMGVGGVFSAGPTSVGDLGATKFTGRNIEWANNLTGATNKAVFMVMDPNNPIYKTMEDTGAALYSGIDKVIGYGTKPILDPRANGQMSSKLFEHIVGSYKPGQEFDVTHQMLKEHGSYLGFSGNGPQHLRIDPRQTAMKAAYEVVDVNGKQHINLVTKTERTMETWKGFSLAHKGTLQRVSGTKWVENLHAIHMNRDRMRRLGIPNRHVVIGTGDMLKKGAGMLDLQMSGAFGFVTGDANYRKTLSTAARSHSLSMLPTHRLGKVYGGVVSSLAGHVLSGKVKAEDAGLVLGGAYFAGEKHSRYAIPVAAQEAAIAQAFGSHAADVLAATKRGVALNPTSFTQGSGIGDYGLGRGSVEPRFVQMLQHRLQNMGMSSVESAKILGGIYSRKLGGSANIKAAQGMLQFLEGVTGTRGLASGVSGILNGAKEYTLADLPTIASQDFAQFVSKHKNGFTLDLTSGADTPAKSAIAASAIDTFGQGKLFFPGSDMLDSMKDVFIKNQNDFDTVVHDEWTRNASNLIQNLSGTTSRTEGAGKESRELFSTFKEKSIKLASATIHNVGRGKIKGMQAMVVAPYALDHNVQFTDAKFNFAKGLTKKSKHHAVFMDSTAFLSQLNDFMGSRQGDISYGARQAERFFLSPELAFANNRLGMAKGIMQIGTRHPEMSIGNIFTTQVYRDVSELGHSNPYLDKFLQTDTGKGWASKGIRKFKDLSNLSNDQRRAFFTQFVGGLDSFAPEGGGQAYIPRMMANVGITGGAKSSLNVDIGFSAAAIGDFDGDTYQFTMLDMDSSKSLLKRMSSKSAQEWMAADSAYKIKSELFTQEAKAGLAKQSGQILDIEEATKQGLLKEQAAKASVGALDTRLGRLRSGLVDMRLSDKGMRANVDEALALLKVLQEHTTIKGKKLPVFKPFAEILTSAVDRAFESDDFGPLESFLKKDVFTGSNLHGPGISIDSIESGEMGAFKQGFKSETVHLDNALTTLKQAVARSKISGISEGTSVGRMAMALGSDNPAEVERIMTLLQSGNTQASALIHGASEGVQAATKHTLAKGQAVLQNAVNYVSGMDRKTMGIAAAGLLTATAVMGMVGAGGYSSEPLTMPGEISGNDVDHSINAGNFLKSGKNYPQATPINMGSTYLKGRSSYSVRGTLGSASDINNAIAYSNGMSGGNMRGSVSVNDNRRPITANYLDRFFGEY